jgi:hypothetical protein
MSIRLEWVPRDLWVGCFWKTTDYSWETQIDLWICLLPCLPIHITWARDRPN